MKEKSGNSFTNRFSGLGNYFHSMRKQLPIPSQEETPREHRRLYVGNIPANITNSELLHFFNQQMYILGLGPIWACQLYSDKRFAFLEFNSVKDTTLALSLNGIYFKEKNLIIRRPKNYQPEVIQKDNLPTYVNPLSPNALYIGALPNFMNDEQVKDLLSPFGKLRAFKHLRDTTTGLSKGFAFCEYEDDGVAYQAIKALNWMQLGNRKLIVQRASLGTKKAQNDSQSVADPSLPPTEVLCLHNVVTPDGLQETKMDDILEDIKVECAKYGVVQSVEMPRPIKGKNVPGCGHVFVLFDSALNCEKARKGLTKRNFNGRVIITSYFDPDKYKNHEF